MANLKKQTISGFFWSFIQNIGTKGISFVIMIVLARLLSPTDFGLIAMLSIFIQISQRIVEAGFGQALIQKLEVDEIDYSSVFYINIVASSLLYVLLFFGAPLVAAFYEQEKLIALLRVMSIIFVINSFSLVQETKIKNDLEFKKLAIIHVPSTIIGGIVALVMAYLDFGVWSIVGLQISTRLSYSLQLWLYSKWIPLWVFQWDRIKVLFSFGGRMLISTIITSIYSNIITIIIGKFYIASQVGFYQTSKNMALTPSTTIKSVADSVTFPAFSKLQNENEKLKPAYKKVMQVLIFWMLPLFTFSAIIARPLFALVLGEKWLPAVPYFRWLCIIAILSPLVNYNLNILKIKGESSLFLKLQLYRRVLTIIAFITVVFFSFGITGLLFVESLSYFVSFLYFSHISGRFINYGLKEQLLDKIPMLILTGVISLILYFSNFIWSINNNFLNVIIIFSLGFMLYLGLSKAMKFPEMSESISIVKEFSGKIKSKIKK